MSILLILFTLISSNEQGITLPIKKMEVVGSVADEVTIGTLPKYERKGLFFFEDVGENWEAVDSISYEGIIPGGKNWVIEINSGLKLLTSDALSQAALDVMELLPEWLRPALKANFKRMSSSLQETYATLIENAPEKHRDEVAFCVAHIDPEILSNPGFNSDLLLENARLIYANDSLLKYVELVEYPDYTTAKYKISDHGSNLQEIEIPYEMYYWNIVHPILSDEAPLYIDPKTGRRANPPTGKFWRDYVFNYPDTAERTVWDWGNPPKDTIHAGFVSPILREELEKAEVLWDGKTDTLDESAVGIVTKWIKDVMVFNSGFGFERPIQPVRIYHIHLGRCGEHADITAAAARAALIPANEPLTMANDHTWNEWYDTQWRGWEPVNTFINSTHHYDNWWDIALPFSFRGDGWIWDVTERYTPSCTLSVKVEDVKGRPVDGARVILASSDNSGNYIVIAGWHYTSSDGETQFIIGDDKPYYARIDAENIGSYPSNPNQVVRVIPKSVAGEHYSWSHRLTGNMPELSVSQDTLPTSRDSLYRVEINFNAEDEIVYGNTLFQNELGVKQRFARFIPKGNIEFFICDPANFSLYEQGKPFNAFCIAEDADSGSVTFTLPKKGKWYAVLSNEDVTTVGQYCSLSCRLLRNISYGVEEGIARGFYLHISPILSGSPVRLEYSLPRDARIALKVYDITGRCVRKIVEGEKKRGCHKEEIEGLNPGIYFIQLSMGDRIETKKLIMVK